MRLTISREARLLLLGVVVVVILYLASAWVLVASAWWGVGLGAVLLGVAAGVKVPDLPILRTITGLFGCVLLAVSAYSLLA